MDLEQVLLTELPDFRQMVDAYFVELFPYLVQQMRHEGGLGDLQECFNWADGNRHPYWAVSEGHRVGFLAYSVDEERRSASINDFYVAPEARRQGYGAAMVQAIYALLD